MTFNIYSKSESGTRFIIAKDSLSEAAVWVATSGNAGMDYLIRKVEEVDITVLTRKPTFDGMDDSDW